MNEIEKRVASVLDKMGVPYTEEFPGAFIPTSFGEIIILPNGDMYLLDKNQSEDNEKPAE